MGAIGATIVLATLLWVLNKVWFGQRGAIGAVAIPFLCVAVYQGVGYLTLGYLDPFIWIAILVQFLICAVTVAALQALCRPALREAWVGWGQPKVMVTIVVVILGTLGLYPWGKESLEQLEVHQTVDRRMLQRATQKAKSVVTAQMALPENYRLESDYNRESNIYEFRFLNQGHLIAAVTLDAVTLEELSVKIEGR